MKCKDCGKEKAFIELGWEGNMCKDCYNLRMAWKERELRREIHGFKRTR